MLKHAFKSGQMNITPSGLMNLFSIPLEQILTSAIILNPQKFYNAKKIVFMTHTTRQMLPLSKQVREALEDYFERLDGHKTTNLYTMVLEEIEAPLFKAVMKHTKNNQSDAADILGISRGTLRKKIKQYKCKSE